LGEEGYLFLNRIKYNIDMQAVIMAGGFGTRLRPLTCNIPKPMTPLLNKPIIEHNINLLKQHGITNLVLILFHQAEFIKNYFKDGSAFGVKIDYVKPDADYGTAGAVYKANEYINDRFIILSGDVVTDFDLTKAIHYHTKKKSFATIVLTRVKNPLQFGIVLTDTGGNITRFYEKPTWSEVFSDTINTGIYILEKSSMEMIPKSRTGTRQDIDFSKDFFPYLLKNNIPLYGCIEKGYWRDVGSLEDYITTNHDALKGKAKLQNFRLSSGGNFIAKSAKVSKDADITNSIIGEKCTVAAGTKIKNSVLWENVEVSENCKLNNDVVCNNVIIDANTHIGESVFIGDNVKCGKNVRMKSGIKIWPSKIIDDNSVVLKNLIWEDRWKDTLFSDSRITGISNIEITPHFGAKIGSVYGSFSGIDSRVYVSRDMDKISRMIKSSIIAGLLSSGVNVFDLQKVPIPILRQELKGGKGAGGIFVRKSPFDASMCDIIFFDSNGKDLPSAKIKTIERLFFSEDYNPVPYSETGDVTYPERTTESYKEHFIEHIDREAVNNHGFRIAINYSHGITATIFPIILSSFNVDIITLDSHLDTTRQTRTKDEFNQALSKLGYITRTLKYDAGFLIDAGGEKIFVTDNKGNVISHDRFLSLATHLFLMANPGTKKIAVPIQATGEVDITAKKYGTEVLRVKDSHYAMMNAADDPDVAFIGGTKGGVIFPKFLYATDGMFSIMKILELLAKTGKSLSEMDELTTKLYMSKTNLPCSKDIKGRIMRKLVEGSGGEKRQLIDGIKIFFDEWTWVLCIPDSERDIFHVNAEAKTKKEADALVKEYSIKIKSLQEN
jgi:mannose-1-phosphate guanylyltransferase / phosphomannomutase